ncbi:MAG: HD domain-containing phosphohydrolase [Hyphomicrobiales bacterium]
MSDTPQDLAVLLVEDSEDDAALLIRALREIGPALIQRVETGEEMRAALAARDWDVVLCDYTLPAFSAIGAMEVVREHGRDIPFIIVSGSVGEETAVQALKAGAADFVMKGNYARLLPAIRRELTEAKNRAHRREIEEALARSHVALERAYQSTLEGWSKALELRDAETEGHSQRVTGLTVEMARRAGFSGEELVHVRRGALLHDIGKMAIPDSVLLKPGPLTAGEWEVMRQHPRHAFEMLSAIEFLRPALDIPLYHHERWDGGGYPAGLAGEEIPLSARLFAVVDVWDALSSARPYKDPWPADRVLAHIDSLRGRHFDPDVVPLFMAALEERAREAA